MKQLKQEFLDDARQWMGQVGHDLVGLVMDGQGADEEPAAPMMSRL